MAKFRKLSDLVEDTVVSIRVLLPRRTYTRYRVGSKALFSGDTNDQFQRLP